MRMVESCFPRRSKFVLYMSAMREAASGERALAHAAVKSGRNGTKELLASTSSGVLQVQVNSVSSVFMGMWGNLAPDDRSAWD